MSKVAVVYYSSSGNTEDMADVIVNAIGADRIEFWAVVLFAVIVALSILLSLAFGQSLDQFAFTEDYSFTGVGIGSAMLTILAASIIEEVGWKGYCEDSIGNYMNWFWESLIFGALWSLWHLPLIFIKGTYQAELMVNPLYVVNFIISGIPLGFIITWVRLVSDRSILACMLFHLFVNFMQEKIAMTPETKCVETIIVTVAAAVIVLANRDLFFGTRHVGRLPDAKAFNPPIGETKKAACSVSGTIAGVCPKTEKRSVGVCGSAPKSAGNPADRIENVLHVSKPAIIPLIMVYHKSDIQSAQIVNHIDNLSQI